ncbi:hypothetical protein F0L74_24905 [Chitinophaga agrisoli]|uniref:WG repeat protein n=1 Tax=Chitinophaga agrisoli TaxID=2607653 RepID=A0A5B2VKV5_9BACT|nr:hypothetical protein [Chitinophaga agrisoli]KAA2239444.1 hypothetical protein F0L74_24905 [Chitinophaga agrisoli]
MKRSITIKTNDLQTISWIGDKIVDWASAGTIYSQDGTVGRLAHGHVGYRFDGAITSPDGQYALVYTRLETKALLLKHGELLREIDRSYYCAEVHEYPAAFITGDNGRTYLIHCPKKYCRLDFEDVETGEIITDHADRAPGDFFIPGWR